MMMRSSVVLLSLFLVVAGAVDPGAKAAVTQRGIDYLRDVFLPPLLSSVSKIPIPGISGEVTTARSPAGSENFACRRKTVSNTQ